jgi:hypothetical protein
MMNPADRSPVDPDRRTHGKNNTIPGTGSATRKTLIVTREDLTNDKTCAIIHTYTETLRS